jgi:S-adenosylmethionine hydrolase
VVLGISPDVTLVDISHDVPPQDIGHGAFVLGSAYRYFTPETIHVAVVDPGVGTPRRALLVVTPSGRFLAPDNGLLAYVLEDEKIRQGRDKAVGSSAGNFMEPLPVPVPRGCSAYALTKSEYWRQPVSRTFHGRDIFAAVAGHLSRGVSPRELGEEVDSVLALHVPAPVARDGGVEGCILFVDHFGNLVTNIRSADLPGGEVQVEIGGVRIAGLSKTFADAEGLLALVGSRGYLEIAEANGSAAERLGAGVGARVRVVLPV